VSASPRALRDLAADAVALVGAIGGRPAHLAGIGVGGMEAQVAALDHPGTLSALTLVGTCAVAPGPPDDDLPTTTRRLMSRLFAQPMPHWTDRDAVAEFASAGAEILGDDPVSARERASEINRARQGQNVHRQSAERTSDLSDVDVPAAGSPSP